MSRSLRIESFSLRDTLESGQFFRFTKNEDTYLIQSHGRLFSLSQRGDLLFYEGIDRRFLIRFFRLEDDFSRILLGIDRDPVIHQAIQKYYGMRLIRQDPWECLLSFLCSPAKAIPQIKLIIESLCQTRGEKVCWKFHIGYRFPKPSSIRSPLELESIRAGFRTKALFHAHQKLDPQKLWSLKKLPYEEARRRLMQCPGVGKKIADCVLLYSLDFLQAFPMDTWIKKGLKKFYFKDRKVSPKEMERFVSDHFGPYAGYAQLYLYHFWRNQAFNRWG
jgi:N-glycosylase/DNA lyase